MIGEEQPPEITQQEGATRQHISSPMVLAIGGGRHGQISFLHNMVMLAAMLIGIFAHCLVEYAVVDAMSCSHWADRGEPSCLRKANECVLFDVTMAVRQGGSTGLKGHPRASELARQKI